MIANRRASSLPAPFPKSLAVVLLLAALGCGEDKQSPTAPEPAPTSKAKAVRTLSFRQVTAGLAHTCGVTLDNQAYCWGGNFKGQLGNGASEGQSTVPVPVAGGLQFRQVSAGLTNTCGVTLDDVAYCWGDNGFAQLGDGTTNPGLTPVAVAGELRFRQVSPGSHHTCGVTTTDQAFCWSALNGFGELGNDVRTARLTPFEVVGGLHFREVHASVISSAIESFTCGVTVDALAYCWGDNTFGQLGNGPASLSFEPVPVAGGLQFRQVSVGDSRTCGLTPDRLAFCWGANFVGGVGDGTTSQRRTPVPVAGELRFRRLSDGGEHHTCGITLARRAYCWGANFFGQIGDGTSTIRLTPVPVVGGLRFRQLATGTNHTCGVTTSHVVYCWGANLDGELGDGTTNNSLTPVAVAAPAR